MARYWGPRIKIDGAWLREDFRLDDPHVNHTAWLGRDAELWEAEVHQVLRKIACSKTGNKLLTLINAPYFDKTKNGKRRKTSTSQICVIMPIRAAAQEQTETRPYDLTVALRKGHLFDCPATQRCSRPPRYGGMVPPHSKLLGRGTGSSVRIYYHPATWNAHSQWLGLDMQQIFEDVAEDFSLSAPDRQFGLDTASDNMQPDDVLFHELVHAYRAMEGLFEWVETGNTWHRTEEFFAIVLTNVYVSEIGRSDSLRGDHSSQFHSLKDVVGSDSDKDFYQAIRSGTNRRLIDQMCGEMPGLTNYLADPAENIGTWNPFRVRKAGD